ncbi:MAG: hypothetical protein DMF59_13950 [Acidobacteria bacterium]|nr:MAG: hypothetical protein DMF59_13950 [Acidobacteriota bacterium]
MFVRTAELLQIPSAVRRAFLLVLQLIDVHIDNAWRIDEHGCAPRIAHWPGARAKSLRAWFAKLLLPVIEPQL